MAGPILRLREWSRAGPDDHPALSDRVLPAAVAPICAALAREGRLEIVELRRGLRIATTSWVGRLELGGLTLAIEPKLEGAPLAALLRYAYGLRDLKLFDHAGHEVGADGLQDLLIHQMLAEVRDLVAAGLHRDYVEVREDLASPRGRIDFARVAGAAARARAVLPCAHHPRSVENPLNVALAGALALAARLAASPALRHRASMLAALILPRPCTEPTRRALDEADASVDRRTRAYLPSLRLARLLLDGAGLTLETGEPVRLPGVLFDMNAFFQALVSRLLAENLSGHAVVAEQSLRDLYAWEAGGNPRRRRTPRPRPDLMVMGGGRVAAIVDAKYRDLWERPLPRDMLYQLTLYALSHGDGAREAVIAYPTLADEAREQAVVLRDPRTGAVAARVASRALHLRALAATLLVTDRRARASALGAMARAVAFGI